MKVPGQLTVLHRPLHLCTEPPTEHCYMHVSASESTKLKPSQIVLNYTESATPSYAAYSTKTPQSSSSCSGNQVVKLR